MTRTLQEWTEYIGSSEWLTDEEAEEFAAELSKHGIQPGAWYKQARKPTADEEAAILPQPVAVRSAMQAYEKMFLRECQRMCREAGAEVPLSVAACNGQRPRVQHAIIHSMLPLLSTECSSILRKEDP